MKNFRRLLIAISNQHDLYYRIVLISVSILTITAFLPRQSKFKYDYAIGQAWAHEDLKAPFDFPLVKSSERLESEKKQLIQNAPLYWKLDSFAEKKALATFLLSAQEDEKTIGSNIIKKIYNKGVLDRNFTHTGADQRAFFIVSNNHEIASALNAHYIYGQLNDVVQNELLASNIVNKDAVAQLIVQAIKPNISYDEQLTEKYKNEILSEISPLFGLVKTGDVIAQKGKSIGEVEFIQLESLKKAYQGEYLSRESYLWLYFGYFLLVCIAVCVLITFLWLLRKDILLDSRKISLLFILIVGTCIMYSMLLTANKMSMLLVPLCILPLVTRAFFDTRTALFTHVLTILIIGTAAPNGFDFVFMQIIAGMVAIFSIVNMRKRGQIFLAVGVIFVAYLISYIGLSLLNEGTIVSVNYSNALWIAGNCLLTLLSYPLIFFIEKAFGVTSDFTLMELTDFNSELLRELAIKAPGTFQHSLQVANLAEAATYKIGGNTLLVRVGALYHDIGKMDMPMYFIENQSTLVNPHDELSFDESASIIISHVIRGIEKAKKFKLPDVIIDFIRTHHGTSVVQYFYQNFLKNFPEEMVNEEDFSYPGPKPFSKETAVLMMADSVEAAARSLAVHDVASIDKLVDNIINHQINDGQFESCDITYRDISSIKRIFKKMLTSIYHVRVAYPTA